MLMPFNAFYSALIIIPLNLKKKTISLIYSDLQKSYFKILDNV